MQSKGFIRFFTILLFIVGIYQLSLYLPTSREERRADRYAKKVGGDNEEAREKARQFYLDSIADKAIVPVFGFTYSEVKQQQLGLGLDLQGGMSVVLQVDLDEFLYAIANNTSDPDFRKAINNAKDRMKSSQKDMITLFGEEFKKVASGKKLAPIFSVNPAMRDKIKFDSPDADVIAVIRTEASATVERTYQLLKQRIDKFGVTSPNVFLDPGTDRITVELPGVKNRERARSFLQASAKLEFWELRDAQELAPGLDALDKQLKAKQERGDKDSLNNRTPDKLLNQDSTEQAPNDTLKKTPAGDTAKVKPLALDTAKGSPADTAKTNQPDTSGMASVGPLFKILGFYGQGQTIGQALGPDTAKINAMLRMPEAGLLQSTRLVWDNSAIEDKAGKRFYRCYALKTIGNSPKAPLEGDVVTDASSQIDQNGRGSYMVTLAMNDQGSQIWAKMTRENVKKQVAIVLDNKVYSAPVVQNEIRGGNTSITGNFTALESGDLANILKIGKLPARTEIIEEAIVGPTLGQASIRSGLTAALIGTLLVMLFVMFYYNNSGVFAVVALLINLFFIIGTLASLGTVLTLSGIAGIALTMGIAIDANIVIFERVREELRRGHDFLAAIRLGFSGSNSAIVDANVTVFLTAAILAFSGTGPIKGFGVTLMVGVLSSFFTAVLLSRLMMDNWTSRGKNIRFWIPMTMNTLANLHYDFIGKRRYAYIFSAIILGAGLVSIAVRGFELGVDLQGGRSYTVVFDKDVNAEELTKTLTVAFEDQKPLVRTFGKANQAKITTSYLQESTEENADALVLQKLYEGTKAYAGFDASLEEFSKMTGDKYLVSSTKVGATVADDLRSGAVNSSTLAILFIFLYILVRFRKWQYSLGAIVATLHDVIMVLALFSLFRGILPFSLEIDQAFIAAILTVIGYSVNDTVIVYDRIREFMNEYARKPMGEVVNLSINTTLSRTILTSATVFLIVLMLFLFGGASLKGFAFALLVGVVTGTYSSVFVAAALVYDLTKNKGPREIKAEEPVVAAKA